MKSKPLPDSGGAKSIFKKYIGWGIVFLIGIVAGAIVSRNLQSAPPPNQPAPSTDELQIKELRSGGYKFVNPLLECDYFKPLHLHYFTEMEEELNKYIALQTSSGIITKVSVYCRDLKEGPWMGINEDEYYSPASLLKLPVMMAVYKKAEHDTGFLKRTIKYDRALSSDFSVNIEASEKLKIGTAYTTEDLVYRMIIYSYNEAAQLLLKTYGVDILNKEVEELGINLTNAGKSENFMSVIDYSTFFRMLYNATYLTKDLSEKALSLLSKCDYKDGIVAGVPKDIMVSHKFGERVFKKDNISQLHDCGIVYAPDKPYLVCIMTSGNDFSKLSPCIAEISSIIYRNINTK